MMLASLFESKTANQRGTEKNPQQYPRWGGMRASEMKYEIQIYVEQKTEERKKKNSGYMFFMLHWNSYIRTQSSNNTLSKLH